MKNILMTFVKYFKWIYALYFFLGNCAIGILKLFIKPDDNLILINSFGGQKFDDSPKALYDVMQMDERFKNYRFVWAFYNPNQIESLPAKAEVIKTDTLK